jgi:predicted transposase YbfD/YdcC
VATTTDKGHGRFERRTLRTTPILTLHRRWPGLAQGFEVTRERTEKGKKTVEVVYGITSLTEGVADARRLSVLVREHWHVENRLHYVRDVTLGEDACRVRKGSAPQVLAALRNAVVHLLSGVEAESRQAATERLAARPDEALHLLGRPSLE